LVFLRGRVVERAMATEAKPICLDDIWMTIEDGNPPFGLKVVEIKSTEWGMHNFEPLPHWIDRGMSYCYGTKTTEMGLVVFFLSGNKPDFNEWRAEKRPPKDTPRIKAGIRAWRLQFEEGELEAHWEDVLKRKRWCEGILVGGEVDRAYIDLHRPPWQCGGCQWAELCEYKYQKTERVKQ